ncbi:cytochrome P450 78A5-like [Impatiens glandulifera]|uniref:cytochrome P450 78A5-like n=1 Tax=Impatiens glandulifera TaxID=253017 RepID=UPI001FB1A14C|nr:cytochrome P450 78A5-like [Impatiens glandulifera]
MAFSVGFTRIRLRALFTRANGICPFGEYARELRRISATSMFSPKKIACVKDSVKTQMELKGMFEIKQVLHYGSLNNMMMTVFGKYYDFGENGDWCEKEEVGKLVSKVDGFVRKIIDDHSMVTDQDNNHGYFVDVLLDLERENKITRSDICPRNRYLFAILLEWILARLVLHPDIQAKALAEIETTIGSSRAVMESDIPNLPYLQAYL